MTGRIHRRPIVAVFVDGSVRFIKQTVSPTTWWALGTMGGGEVVSADSF